VRRLAKIAAGFRFVKAEAGVTAIEYGLIAMLVAIAIVTSVTLVGTKLVAIFTKVAGSFLTT